MPRTIGFFGSVALLVSSITGPSLVIIPLLFQQAGWLTPLLAFSTISVLSGTAALFIVEIMSSIEGNESFQASIEFTTIAHLFLGKRWHVVIQGLLFLAMQVLVIASLLESFQSMDAFLISVARKTCAVSFTEGWVCVDQIQPNSHSAFPGYILGSFGTLITMSLIFPLSLVHLVDNIHFQIASFIVLIIITVAWIVLFAITGLNTNPVPVVGRDQSSVVGFVLSNFSFVTTVPAWVNNTHPSVNIRRAVWLSVFISCLIYIPVGWMGGSAFALPNSATLLQVFATESGHGALSMVARVSSYVFPLAVLITSIPVFTIVIRYNLLRGNVCSYKAALFWSAVFPWLIAIPFQTNGGLTTILNWASLIFTSPSNLLIPFILFILSKRHMATAVLDASVPPEEPITSTSHAVVSLAPGGQPLTRRSTVAPVENIPVLIITDSTDVDPESTEEMKRYMSSETYKERVEPSVSEVIPMSVTHRVSSPSKHRHYGQHPSGPSRSSTRGSGSGHQAERKSARRQSPTVDRRTGSTSMERPVLLLDTTAPSLARSPLDDHDHDHDHSPHPHPHPHARRPSLSISLSRSHSITHSSSSGMDEFFLISGSSPTSRSRSHSVRSVLSTRSGHSPRASASSGVGVGVGVGMGGGGGGGGGEGGGEGHRPQLGAGSPDGYSPAPFHSHSHAHSHSLSLSRPDDGRGHDTKDTKETSPRTGPDARPADVRITVSTPTSTSSSTSSSSSSTATSTPISPSPSTPTPTLVQLPDPDPDPYPDPESESESEPVPTFKAFPALSPESAFRATRISSVGGVLASALVLTAIVYDIVQNVGGG